MNSDIRNYLNYIPVSDGRHIVIREIERLEKRVEDLLENNNELLERARKAEKK